MNVDKARSRSRAWLGAAWFNAIAQRDEAREWAIRLKRERATWKRKAEELEELTGNESFQCLVAIAERDEARAELAARNRQRCETCRHQEPVQFSSNGAVQVEVNRLFCYMHHRYQEREQYCSEWEAKDE